MTAAEPRKAEADRLADAIEGALGECEFTHDLIADIRALGAEVVRLRRLLSNACQCRASHECAKCYAQRTEIERLRDALHAVCDVGDRAAVLTAREALGEPQ
jgi:hypothetical protein